MKKSAFLPMIAVAALALGAAPAYAQSGAQPGAPGQGQGPGQMQQQGPAQGPGQMQQQAPGAAAFTEDELRSFGEAAVAVRAINEEYMGQMQAAPTPDRQQAVREEATGKMVEAIEDKGLSAEKYMDIYEAAVSDPEFAAEVNAHVQEAQRAAAQ